MTSHTGPKEDLLDVGMVLGRCTAFGRRTSLKLSSIFFRSGQSRKKSCLKLKKLYINSIGSNEEPHEPLRPKPNPMRENLGLLQVLGSLWTPFRNRMVRWQEPCAIKPDMLGINGCQINKGILLHPISSTEIEERFSPDTTAQTPAICRYRGF